MKNRFGTIMMIAVIAVAFVVGSAEARTWKISHVRPQGTAIDNDLKWFAKTIKDASAGKMKVKIYPASALGDYTVVQERVGLGAVDMACQPPASAADKRFQLAYFPYMVKRWEQAKKKLLKGCTPAGDDCRIVRKAGDSSAGGMAGLLRRYIPEHGAQVSG